jgi:hypothetical protein
MFLRSSSYPQPYQPIQPIEKKVWTVLVLFALMLLFIIYMFDPAITHSLTSETGFFEVMSPPLWVALAALCLTQLGYRNRWGIGTMLLSLIFAAREMDLHKAFTADSIFKHAFYKMDISLTQKVLGGLMAALCVAILLWMTVACILYLYRQKGWRQAWGRLTILSIGLIFITKVCDRLEATLAVDYHIYMSVVQGEICNMFEEGFEMLLPITFGIALVCWRRTATRIG